MNHDKALLLFTVHRHVFQLVIYKKIVHSELVFSFPPKKLLSKTKTKRDSCNNTYIFHFSVNIVSKCFDESSRLNVYLYERYIFKRINNCRTCTYLTDIYLVKIIHVNQYQVWIIYDGFSESVKILLSWISLNLMSTISHQIHLLHI